MQMIRSLAAVVAASALLSTASWADATKIPASAFRDYVLNKEVALKNWVLCNSQPNAESLVKAQDFSKAEALKTYHSLQAESACNMYEDLTAKLETPLRATAKAQAFSAQIYIAAADMWATAFVVTGVQTQ
jgi:hypothetical protein